MEDGLFPGRYRRAVERAGLGQARPLRWLGPRSVVEPDGPRTRPSRQRAGSDRQFDAKRGGHTMRRRSGFTLLELVLALAIGVVLLAALYLALLTQFQHARSGRAVLDEAAMVRSL